MGSKCFQNTIHSLHENSDSENKQKNIRYSMIEPLYNVYTSFKDDKGRRGAVGCTSNS